MWCCSTRCSMSTCYSFSLLLLLLIFAFLSTLGVGAQPSSEADTISWDRHLSGNQTIVSREGNFELGFFTPAGNSPNSYIGIWYKKISKKTIIWVANREVPVSSASMSGLGISRDGKLVLYQNGNLVWSSHSHATTLAANSSVAVLLDTGNLVLRDRNNSSAIIWQSFDHLTDTWLPGGWIGMNKVSGEYQSLNSWKSTEDPSPGPFTCTIDPDGTNQVNYMWNGTESYWSSGVWNGRDFSNVPGVLTNEIFRFVFDDNSEQRYFTIIPQDNTSISRNVIDTSGQARGYFWTDSAQDWLPVFAEPSSLCDVYSACSAFGICDESTIVCACPPGFEPASIKEWNLNSWSDGCTRKTQLQCVNSSTNEESDGFLILQNMRLPVNPRPLTGHSAAQQCKLACLNNCSCTAYTYTNADGCLLWIGDIRNLQQLDYDSKAGTLYLRLAASDIPKSSNKKKTVTKIIIVSIVAVTLLMIIGLTWISRRRLYQTWKPADGPLVSFSYSDLQRITKNFSEILGRGGFGCVFRGVLADSTIVAVKKLEGLRQGEKQFRTEVSTLGTIQHVNLVRLRGFCCKGTKRLLVYDYMPNGSLDNLLFKSSALDWRTRYQIILGIAKGIEYLHEKCRECIIHCDIKPENILIDADFCPKVADFGIAKLLGRAFSRVLTTMRGTIGYMAPEWTSGQPITPKVDVYSYGMMLFEIVHGRRNTDQSKDERFNYFPIWAAGKVIEGEVLSILDENLEGNADLEELGRVCKVACWCIQDYEVHRPSMGQVVLMLEGVMEVHIPPVPSYLQRLTNYKDSSISSVKSDTSGHGILSI